MVYDNNTSPSGILWAPTKTETDWTVRQGTTLRQTPYTSLSLDGAVSDQDQIVVVRTFPISDVTPTPATPFTGEQVWKLWTLPATNSSGSPMYTISEDSTVVMSATAADYKITLEGVEYTTPVFDYTAHDTYVLRRTYSKEGFVNWQAGSRITSAQLNHSMQQVINLLQEGIIRDLNREKFDPFIGQANGVAQLDSDGKIPNSLIGATTLGINTELGVQGDGTSDNKLRLKINGASLAATSDGLSVSVVNDLTTGGTTLALSAEQGKILKTSLDTVGTGFSYQGTFDISSGAGTAAPTGAESGHTYDVIGTGTDVTMTNLNDIVLTAGDIIRYDGSAWVEVAQASVLRADGTVALESGVTLDLDAGTSVLVPNVTYGTSVDDTKAANTAYVKDAIEALQVESLSDVDVSGVAAKSVIQSDGDGTWSLKKGVFDEDVECTGLKLDNLADVVDAPTTNHYLKYNGSSWISADVSVTNLVVGINSSADFGGGADASEHIQNAWIDSTLGHTGTPTSSTLRVLEMNGGKFLMGDAGGTDYAIPVAANRVYSTHRQDVTYRNGHLQWKGIDTISNLVGGVSLANDAILYPYMISPTDTTGAAAGAESAGVYLQTQTLDATNGATTPQYLAQSITEDMCEGQTIVTVANTSSMKAGMVIQIMPKDESTLTAVEDANRKDNATSSAMYHYMTNRIKRVLSDTTFELETPNPKGYLTADKYKVVLSLYHTDSATESSGLSQPRRIKYEDMHFENLCSKYYHLGNNPLDFPDTANGSFVCTLPSAHGFPADKEVLASFDSITLQDGLDATFYWGDINRMTKDFTATGTYGVGKLVNKVVSPVTGSLSTSELAGILGDTGGSTATPASVGAIGGNLGVIGIGYERGIRIENASDIVFENCTFDGWAEAVILDSCYNILFKNCTFNSPLWTGKGSDSTGIKLIGCTNVTIENCTFNGAMYGIKNIDTTYSCFNVNVLDCHFTDVVCAVYLTGITHGIRIEKCDIKTRAMNPRRIAPSRGVDNSGWGIEVEGSAIVIRENSVSGCQPANVFDESWDADKYGRSAAGSTYFDVAGGWDGGTFSANDAMSTSKGIRAVVTGLGIRRGNSFARTGRSKDIVVKGNEVRGWQAGIHIQLKGGSTDRPFHIKGVEVVENNVIFGRFGTLVECGFESCWDVLFTRIENNSFMSDNIVGTTIPSGLSSERNVWGYRWDESDDFIVGGINDNSHYGNDLHLYGPQFGVRMGVAPEPTTDIHGGQEMHHSTVRGNIVHLHKTTAQYGGVETTGYHAWGHCIGHARQDRWTIRSGINSDNICYGGYAQHTISVCRNNTSYSPLHGWMFHNDMNINNEYSAYNMYRYGKFDNDNREKRFDLHFSTTDGGY